MLQWIDTSKGLVPAHRSVQLVLVGVFGPLSLARSNLDHTCESLGSRTLRGFLIDHLSLPSESKTSREVESPGRVARGAEGVVVEGVRDEDAVP